MAADALTVSVSLDEVSPSHAKPSLFPVRVLTLQDPNWSVKIGRATSSGSGPRQDTINAWYSSRVVSREHAELRADPVTREVLIRDCGSMHGTHVEGRRLKRGITERLYTGDTVVFGAEVARGDETFLPVEVVATYQWSDGIHRPATSNPNSNPTRNHFAVYYSDEDLDDYESDESMQSADNPAPRNKGGSKIVSEEESGDSASIISDEASLSDEESPASSPIISTSPESKGQGDEGKQLPDQHKMETNNPLYSSARLSPSLGEPADITYDQLDDGEDSYYEDSSVFEEEHERQATGDESNAAIKLKTPSNLAGLSEDVAPPILPPPLPHSAPGRPIREPSPSDAAMAKPPVEDRSQPSSYFYPTYSPAYSNPYHNAPEAIPAPPVLGRDSSAWAGYNSVLYDSVPQPMIQDSYYPTYEPMAHAIEDAHEAYRPLHLEPFEPQTDFGRFHAISPRRYPELGLDSGKGGKAGEKRKRDNAGDDEVLVKNSIEMQAAQENLQPATVNPADLQPILVAATVESIKSPIAEPTKKKQKKKHVKDDSVDRMVNNNPTFAKYAATALAGVAVGAVGTIFGLVALPKDFFV